MKKIEITVRTLTDTLTYARSLPPQKKIWGDLICDNQIIHFPAERGTGKTMLLMQLLYGVSGGLHEFCGFPISEFGCVLFINYEIPERLFAPRFLKIFGNLPQAKFEYKIIHALGKTFSTSLAEIEKALIDFKPVLVVIDSWQLAFADVDNNKANATAAAVMQIRQMAEQYSCAIIVADHLRKGTKYESTDSDLQSGSGVKSNFFDQDFFLRRSTQNKQFRVITRSKYRYSAEEEGSTLVRLNPDTIFFELIEKNVDETEHLIDPAFLKARNLKKEGKSLRQIAQETGLAKSSLHRNL